MVARLVQDRALLEEKRSQQAARSHRHLPHNKNRSYMAMFFYVLHPGRRDHRSRVSTGQLHLIPAGEPWGWVLREAHPTPLGGEC